MPGILSEAIAAKYEIRRSDTLSATHRQSTPMKLLVRNLDRNFSEDELRALFESHGNVQSCSLVMDQNTGTSKGFGFVEMPKAGEAKAAMKQLNNTAVSGQTIRVKKAD